MNISYLIENSNHVYVDSKLVEDYQRQSKGVPQKATSPKEFKPNKKLEVSHAVKNKSPSNDKTKPSKDIIYKVPTQPQPARKVKSQVFSEDECIEILQAKVADIRERQRQSQLHYQNVLAKLRQEVQRVDREYDIELQQYEKVRVELSDTKRDLADLTEIIQATSMSRASQAASSRTNGTQKELLGTARSMKDLS